MVWLLLHFLTGVDGGVSVLSGPRSPKWRALRDRHLKEKPRCEVCGCEMGVVPHHIVPVHVDPSKELEPSNLISLCEGRTFNCHLFFGHLKRWDRHNPFVVEDAARWRDRISGLNPPPSRP